MGCVPSNVAATTAKNHDRTGLINNSVFTTDERLKLKEVWVIVKQNGLKKLGDDIMNKALERNSSLKTYWYNLAINDQNNILTFDENDTITTTDFIWKQSFKQHGYKILDKIDQLIMIMVTHISTTDANDTILNEHFHRIAESHAQYKIKQDHIDMICESFNECIKNVVYQNGSEWTIKHAITWQKFLTLITNQFSSVTINSSTTKYGL